MLSIKVGKEILNCTKTTRYVVIVANAPINVLFDTSNALKGEIGELTLSFSVSCLILFLFLHKQIGSPRTEPETTFLLNTSFKV